MATNLPPLLLALKAGILDNQTVTDQEMSLIDGIAIIGRLLRADTPYVNSYLYAGALVPDGDDLIGIVNSATLLTTRQKKQIKNFLTSKDLDL